MFNPLRELLLIDQMRGRWKKKIFIEGAVQYRLMSFASRKIEVNSPKSHTKEKTLHYELRMKIELEPMKQASARRRAALTRKTAENHNCKKSTPRNRKT
jgi:hypothetical protein